MGKLGDKVEEMKTAELVIRKECFKGQAGRDRAGLQELGVGE